MKPEARGRHSGIRRRSRQALLRGAGGLSSFDVPTLTGLLLEAEKGHGQYVPTAPPHHWSDWYAAYIVAREHGKTPEDAAKDGVRHVEGSGR
jgi:hypothetical protein